ncbi:hypothetical protein ACSBR2_030816 [Camellia fascicularis]
MSLSYLVGCFAAMGEPPNGREFEQGNSKKKNRVVEIEVSNDDGDDVDRRGEVMETTGKKRKKRKREPSRELKTEEALLQDPLTVFGSDIMFMILRHLNAPSVALSLLTSRTWYGVASSDSLWKRKAAPEYWQNLDPYWKGTGPPMRRYFHLDGTLTADPGDEAWGGHESCYSIVTSFVGDGKIREHYVRINRWPRLSVSRKHDWSWELSNYLYCYSSIPDAHKEGGTGPLFHFC